MKRSLFAAALLACLAIASGSLSAQGTKRFSRAPEEFEARLAYQTGTVVLRGGMATLHLPKSFRFIGPEGAPAADRGLEQPARRS